MKKIVSVLLSLALFFSMVTLADLNISFAASPSGSCGTNAKYEYDSATKTLKISGKGTTADYTKGNTFIGRPPWQDYKGECEKIIIEEGITGIGMLNFYNMTAVTSVEMADSVTDIGEGSFDNMTALETIKFGAGVKTVGLEAFRYDSALRSVEFNEGLESLGDYAFANCIALESVTFPNSLTKIGTSLGYAFSECTSLTDVTYGNTITTTGKYTFYNAGVRNIHWGASIVTVDNWCFYGCPMTTVEIPEQIKDINIRSFSNMYALSKVYVYSRDCNFNGLAGGEDPFKGSQQDLTFYGYFKSTTQTYAENKGYNFVPLDECSHEVMNEVSVRNPTCTEDGERILRCANCGVYTETEILPSPGHQYVTYETSDMTDVDGHKYEYQQCSVCEEENCVYTHNNWVEGYYTVTSTATCEKGGFETRTCDICGKKSVPVPVLSGGHKIENYSSSTDATCTDSGTRTGLCTVCGETVTETIPPKGHSESITKTSTTEDGHTYNTYTCSVCYNEREETVHNEWVEGYYTTDVISPVSCDSNGQTEYTCSVCGETKIETNYMTGHSTEYYNGGVVTSEPTCTQAGTTTYTCTKCGKTREIAYPLALNHDFTVETVLNPPTCTERGTMQQKCSRCEESKTYEIPALGHNIDGAEDFEEVSAPNCTTPGTNQGTCSECGEFVQVEVPPLDHNFDEENAIVTEAPTCVNEGKATVECDRCGETKEISVPKTGHDYKFCGGGEETLGISLYYDCKVCRDRVKWPVAIIRPLFEANINRYNEEVTGGAAYLIDLNGDGVINVRDFSILKRYYVN